MPWHTYVARASIAVAYVCGASNAAGLKPTLQYFLSGGQVDLVRFAARTHVRPTVIRVVKRTNSSQLPTLAYVLYCCFTGALLPGQD